MFRGVGLATLRANANPGTFKVDERVASSALQKARN